MTRQQRHACEEQRRGDGGRCPVPRRSFLKGVLGGAAATAAANLLPTGVVYAQRADVFGLDAPTWAAGVRR